MGCQFKGVQVSAIMYADDLVLLAPSISELQAMTDKCSVQLDLIGLQINSTKSYAIRIGNRFNTASCNIIVDGLEIMWGSSAKYLGTTILTGSKFKCCIDKIKSKFYRSANAILGKINCHDNAIVSVNLVSSIALPVFMYSIEALGLNKSEVNILDHPWSRIFEKNIWNF